MGYKQRIIWKLCVIVGVSLITQIPYFYAGLRGNGEYVFGGFLLNPLDGYTYLAKMYEGWRGDWQFTLPYTAEVGKGSYLFLFYILLGHTARLFNLPLIVMFHIARLGATLFMLLAIARFYERTLNDERLQLSAFTLSALGSGMGWLAIMAGKVTSDFWVAEAFPFLSAYANPHFPLALGLLVCILTPLGEAGNFNLPDGVRTSIFALTLGLISPFGVLIAMMITGIALTGSFFLEYWIKDETTFIQLRNYGKRFFWVFVFGGSIVLYEYWTQKNDPLLTIWNSQNVTPSPPLWDFFLSFSPAFVLALLGMGMIIRKPEVRSTILLAWVGSMFLLVYLPTALQRRFLMGFYIPIIALALGWGKFQNLARNHEGYRKYNVYFLILLITILPTNIMVILSSLHGISTYNEMIYLRKSEMDAFIWIEENTTNDSVILGSPETGLFIPAFSGRRVLYGHPYETVNARQEEAWVKDFFHNKIKEDSLYESLSKASHSIDYIFWGPREANLSRPGAESVIALQISSVYQNDDVRIYQLRK